MKQVGFHKIKGDENQDSYQEITFLIRVVMGKVDINNKYIIKINFKIKIKQTNNSQEKTFANHIPAKRLTFRIDEEDDQMTAKKLRGRDGKKD